MVFIIKHGWVYWARFFKYLKVRRGSISCFLKTEKKMQYAIKSMLFSRYLLFQQKRTLLMERDTDFDCYREFKVGRIWKVWTFKYYLAMRCRALKMHTLMDTMGNFSYWTLIWIIRIIAQFITFRLFTQALWKKH